MTRALCERSESSNNDFAAASNEDSLHQTQIFFDRIVCRRRCLVLILEGEGAGGKLARTVVSTVLEGGGGVLQPRTAICTGSVKRRIPTKSPTQLLPAKLLFKVQQITLVTTVGPYRKHFAPMCA